MCIPQRHLLYRIKVIVHPKIKILSFFYTPHFLLGNTKDFFKIVEKKNWSIQWKSVASKTTLAPTHFHCTDIRKKRHCPKNLLWCSIEENQLWNRLGTTWMYTVCLHFKKISLQATSGLPLDMQNHSVWFQVRGLSNEGSDILAKVRYHNACSR